MIDIDDWLGRVYVGDCLEFMRQLPDGCVDAVVTDPPYSLPARHYDTRTQFPRSLTDLVMLEYFFADCMKEIARILNSAGCWYMFCDGQSYPVFYGLCYQHTRAVRPLVWDKGTSVNGYHWRHQHELIMFGVMRDTPPIPTGDGDVLRYPAVPVENRSHPAEKPTDLLMRLVTKTAGGATIFDPFLGSGTTAVACERLGRRWLGCEINSEYANMAEERIARERAQLKLEMPVA